MSNTAVPFNKFIFSVALLFFMTPFASTWAQIRSGEVRIKDLVNIRGVRDNQLLGLGLVVGLKGTGDSSKSLATHKAVATMLSRLGMQTKSEEAVSGNVAAVIATLSLPAFARVGDQLDVRISAFGDSQSLAGGTLLLTPLKAGDGKVYVMAQGPVVIGTAAGDGVQVQTVARIPAGGTVERAFTPLLAVDNKMRLSLRKADFTTNLRIVDRINQYFRGFYATSLDPSAIEIEIPPLFKGKTVEFISEMERLSVAPDRKAVVSINERTGTVVMGQNVYIAPVTIAHGDLSIKIEMPKKKSKALEKALETSANEEESKDKKEPESYEREDRAINFGGTTVGDLVETLNDLGVQPKDLVAILQAIDAAGALDGQLKFM